MRRIRRAIPFALASALFVAAAGSAPAADPTTADCLTANDKSISLRNSHKLLTARTQLLVCAAASCPADVRKECVRRIDQVNASMPTVVFEVKDGSGNDLTAVNVKMDGEIVVERLEGTAISLDPGAHAFTFEVVGQPVVTRQLVIHEGQKDRREVIQIGPTASQQPAPPVPNLGAPPAAPPASTPSPEPAKEGLGTQRILGLAVASVGVVGVGIGSIFGLQAMSKHNDAANACPKACVDQNGVKLWDDARSSGNISTIAFAVGGLGLAGGGVLWFTAKSGNASNVRVGGGPGSLQVRGEW
jgi:hypothetical protein